MDPQKLSQLDPKLRDAYQRVMGTAIPKSQAAPASPKLQQDEPAQTQTPPPAGGSVTPIPTPQPQPHPEPKPVPPPAAPTKPPVQPPAFEPQFTPPMPKPVSEPQPAVNPQPQVASTPEPTISAKENSNFTQMNSEVATPPTDTSPNFTPPAQQAQTAIIKKKSNILMPIVIGIGALAFIVVYTFFWTKFFNFKIPFLP